MVQLTLLRTYGPSGTNGQLLSEGELLTHTIELPWQDNAKRKSCIPEGSYKLKKFVSKKHGVVLEVCNVPDRSAILIHSANDAKVELLGCIAPVTTLDRNHFGVGWNSKKALKKVLEFVLPLLEKGEVVLTIKKA